MDRNVNKLPMIRPVEQDSPIHRGVMRKAYASNQRLKRDKERENAF
jgi:hypothetical protein